MLQNNNVLTEFIFSKFNAVNIVDTDIGKQQKVESKILNVIHRVKSSLYVLNA